MTFLFSGTATPSLGTIDMRVPISSYFYALLRIDVVDIDVPLLFGLDALEALRLYINNVENALKCDVRGICTPLVRKDGHIYLEWGADVHYTTLELDRIHRHFNHPQPERLSAILRQAGDPKATPGTHAQLEELTRACDVCQRLSRAPGRFRVALPPEELIFNRTILMDLMFLDGQPVLHTIDKVTLLSAAGFLTEGETAGAVWNLYLRLWVCPYAGHPEIMRTDQGSQFASAGWKALVHTAGTRLAVSGVEAHNALGVGERYHAYLRGIYRRVRMENGSLPKEVTLSLAVAAMNQTAGPRGLSPTLLVLGIVPRMPVAPLPLPAQRDRAYALATALTQMQGLVASARLRKALVAPVPAAAGADIEPGMEVLLYRERPVNQWVGPYVVTARKDKMAWLAIDGHLKAFRVDKLKKMRPPIGWSQPVPATASTSARDASPAAGGCPSITTGTSQRRTLIGPTTEGTPAGGPSPAGDPAEGAGAPPRRAQGEATQPDEMTPEPAGELDLGGLLDDVIAEEGFLSTVSTGCRQFMHREAARAAVHITKVIPAADPLVQTARFQKAARKEVAGLYERGAFRVVKMADVPAGANIISGRFVYTLKNVGSKDEMAKGRYVAQGQSDQAKPFVVHNLATLRQRSTRLLVSTSAILGIRVFAHDITQAYLQSEELFARELYLRPKPQDRHLFDIKSDEVLLVV